MGDISTLNLLYVQSARSSIDATVSHWKYQYISAPIGRFHLRVVFIPPPHRRRDRHGRLASLKPRWHFSVRMLTLLTSPGRLSLP
jgi:hypothetical protein